MESDFAFLPEEADVLDFIDEVDGGNYTDELIASLSDQTDIERTIDSSNGWQYDMWSHDGPWLLRPERKPKPNPTAAALKADYINVHTRENPPTKQGKRRTMPWPRHHFVWRAPEGSGKSSIVNELVERNFKVVFCAKSNDQLVEQMLGFKQRWPDLKIARFISRGRHLQERLAEMSIKFDLIYKQGPSPYTGQHVDEPLTILALRGALDEHGYEHVDHREFFEKMYLQYKSPKIVGIDVDVIMMTLTAFQAMCQGHRPWWETLGLLTGFKRVLFRYKEDADEILHPGHRPLPSIIPSSQVAPMEDEQGRKLKTAEIGIPKIIVIVDDPDRADFDVRRLVEDEEHARKLQSFEHVPEKKRMQATEQYWLNAGKPSFLAREIAAYQEEQNRAHEIEEFAEHYFEHRPKKLHIGYGLHYNFNRKDSHAPKILVTTTEYITADLAKRTLNKQMRWPGGVGPRKIDTPTGDSHTTILSTKLVRKSDRALLLLIHMALREEFPEQDLRLIADAIGSDLNLMNNKGRNDLMDSATLIKLSVPNPAVAMNLWAQYPRSERKGVLNTILLADLANQAIGRNQGKRYMGRPAMLLVDPIYARALVRSGLIRYEFTPWSFHEPHKPNVEITEIETRLMWYLKNARNFGMSLRAYRYGLEMTDRQWSVYEEWLDRNNVVVPKELRRNPQ